MERDATFERAADVDQDAIDGAYRSKYARYGRGYIDAMIAPSARVTTMRVRPA